MEAERRGQRRRQKEKVHELDEECGRSLHMYLGELFDPHPLRRLLR